MGAITVRQLDEATKRNLRIRAAENGHSMEQEARNILKAALTPGLAPAVDIPVEAPTVGMPGETWVDRIRRRFEEIGYAEDLVIEPREEMAEVRVKFDE